VLFCFRCARRRWQRWAVWCTTRWRSPCSRRYVHIKSFIHITSFSEPRREHACATPICSQVTRFPPAQVLPRAKALIFDRTQRVRLAVVDLLLEVLHRRESCES
jgi:hypothetical protein